MFSDSLAGSAGSALWRQNPALGFGLTFGAGASAYAGVHTFVATPGGPGEKAEAASSSAGKYLGYGTLGMTGLLMAAGTQAGRGNVAGLGYRAFSLGQRYLQGTANDFTKGWVSAVKESSTVGITSGTRFRGMMGGLGRVGERKLLMAGIGTGLGAAIGAALDKDDPEAGAKRGAVIGGGAGLAAAVGLRGSRIWKGIGLAGHAGVIGMLSVGAFGAASILSRKRYASMDQAAPEDNGLRDRMNSMSASGDLVLGLHNSR